VSILWSLAGIAAIFFLIVLIKFFGLRLRASVSGAKVGLGRLIGMWIRKVNARIVVESRIMLAEAGLLIHTDLLETHFLTGGDVVKVSLALVAASKAGIELSFRQAAAIDLAGRDVLDAVKTSVTDSSNPKPAESISKRR